MEYQKEFAQIVEEYWNDDIFPEIKTAIEVNIARKCCYLKIDKFGWSCKWGRVNREGDALEFRIRKRDEILQGN